MRGSSAASSPLEITGEREPTGERETQSRLGSRWESELPSFPFLLGLVGKTPVRGMGRHCPPATIS